MRLFTLLALAGVLIAGPAVAQTQLETTSKREHRVLVAPETTLSPVLSELSSGSLFFEGFETSTDTETPAGWTVENNNGDTQAWEAIEQPGRAHTGDFAAAIFWNSDEAHDDWMISPAISFPGAGNWELTFWFKPGDAGFGTAESMEVWLGEGGPSSTDMQVQLLDIDAVPAGDYIQYTATFETFTAGDGYLGFYCNSAADQYFCAVDDITVDAAASGPRLAADITDVDFGNVAVGETAEATVTFENTGTSTLSISQTSLTNADVFGNDLSGFSSSFDPGDTGTVVLSFTPSADGERTATFLVLSDDPDSPLEIPLVGTGVVPPANDDFADATVINMGGVFTGSNVFATTQDGEPDPSCATSFGSSVFFDYTSGGDGTIDVSLTGSTFDTILTIHNPADLAELGCNDDDVGLTSGISGFAVANGTRVLIRIGGYQAFDNGEGDFTMTLTENFGTAIGDDPDAAFALSAPRPNPTAGTFRMDLRMASPEAVRVSVYDMLGREVAVVHDGPVAAGETSLTGSMDALPAGKYLVRATGPSFVSTRSLTVVR